MTFDDSALLHGRAPYDPNKAHEYYLRTRQLHGRKAGSGQSSSGRKGAAPKAAAKPHQSQKEKVAALEKRLTRLKSVLAQLVKEAKARSGVKSQPTATKKTAASSTGGGSKRTTAQERREAAKRSEAYRRKHPEKQKPSDEVEALQKQIKEIRAKIEKAVEEARRAQRHSTTKTAPKGR